MRFEFESNFCYDWRSFFFFISRAKFKKAFQSIVDYNNIPGNPRGHYISLFGFNMYILTKYE